MPEADKWSRETLQNLTAVPRAWRQGPANVGAPAPQVIPHAAQPEPELPQPRAPPAPRVRTGRPSA
eukprot:1168240-Alexandrium_andersonii.AAC.1